MYQKLFLRLIKTPTPNCLWSLAFVSSSTKSINTIDVKLFDLNPYWLSEINLYLSKEKKKKKKNQIMMIWVHQHLCVFFNTDIKMLECPDYC